MAINRYDTWTKNPYRYFDKVEFTSGGVQRSLGWEPNAFSIVSIEDWRVALRAYVAEIQAERKKAS